MLIAQATGSTTTLRFANHQKATAHFAFIDSVSVCLDECLGLHPGEPRPDD